jgi:hypothetical protein
VDTNNFALTGATPTGGNWSGTAVDTNYFNPTLAGAGNHYLTYTFTDANSCTNSDSTIQDVFALPIVQMSGLANYYCQNDTNITLVGTPTGGTFIGTGITSNNEFSPTLAGLGYHSIVYTYTDINSCTSSDTATTLINGAPSFNLGSDTTICANDSLVLDAGGYNAFAWNTGDTTQTIIADTNNVGISSFTYSVIVTNVHSCSATDSITVSYEGIPVSQLIDTASICGEGASLLLDAGFDTSYTYLWSDGSSSATITVDTTTLGSSMAYVSVNIQTPIGCTLNDSVFVHFREIPMVNLGNDTTVCWNHSYTMDAGAGFTSYLWNTGETTQSITVDSLKFILGSNDYTVEVINADNCSNSDTITLVVDPCTGLLTPELANMDMRIFPNPSKGLFQIDIIGMENADYDLEIYNAVGSKVYGKQISYSGNDLQSYKIDLRSYAKGVYIVRLHSKGQIKVKRIIVQ